MNKTGCRGWAYILIALALAGCARRPKPDEPELPAPLRINQPPDYTFTCVALSPDGKTLAYGLDPIVSKPYPVSKDDRGQAILCDAHSGKELFRLRGRVHSWPHEANFSPDGKQILVGYADAELSLWDVLTGTKAADLIGTTLHGGVPEWTPDGSLLTGRAVQQEHGLEQNDAKLHLWSPKDGKQVRALDLDGPVGRWAGYALAADGRTLAVEQRLTERVHPDEPHERDYLYRWRIAVDLWDFGSGRRLGPVADFSPPEESYLGPPSRFPEVGAEAGRFKAIALPGGRYLLLPTYDDNPFLTLVPSGDAKSLTETLTGRAVRRPGEGKDDARPTALSANGDTLVEMEEVSKKPTEMSILVYDISALNHAARRSAASLTAEQVAPFWTALADRDAAKAFPAMRLLALNPGPAVDLLKRHLRPVERRPASGLIADLGSDDFGTREAASAVLASLGESARPELEKALAAGPGPEASRRLHELLDRLKGDVAPDELRGVRAVDVLEQVGTDPARAVLKDLAGGATGALTTQAAKDALGRLDKAPKP